LRLGRRDGRVGDLDLGLLQLELGVDLQAAAFCWASVASASATAAW
jgi:hypothetical protein